MKIERLSLIVGARPNFVKAAPLLKALKQRDRFKVRLIHTGQHFDADMSKVFFDQLSMPEPDLYLGINQGSPVEQIAKVMIALETEFIKNQDDLVVVFGDVNSTLAASLAASKLHIPIAHVEAGLRSYDRTMPEEHNRVATDHLADYLFTPSKDADKNLDNEGLSKEKIFRVGNIMVDSLLRFAPVAKQSTILDEYQLSEQSYGLVTLHRQANVDEPEALDEILGALAEIGTQIPLLFPVHPRTRQQLQKLGWIARLEAQRVRLTPPLGYLEFIKLMMHARVILTDSGGIQEESTVLGVPCITVRANTERPITISEGTNILAGISGPGMLNAFREVMNQKIPEPKNIDLWDGKTAERIAEILVGLAD